MPSCDVTWLHISDAHFGAPDMTGALDSFIAMLLDDLQRMRSERSLVPDFLFFTGDIAFGELPHSQLADQYLAAQELLSKIEELFQLPRLNPGAQALLTYARHRRVSASAGPSSEHRRLRVLRRGHRRLGREPFHRASQ